MHPKQAVILCGGLGTRMKPLTDSMPKPLAPVNGHPFLEELVIQLRDQGIERIVLLTGYRGEMISDYFADGQKFAVDITYSHGPAEWDTGRRVWEARQLLEPRFMLLYSDNFVPFRLGKLLALHESREPIISLLVHPKQPGNIRLSADGRVESYDSKRSEPDLNYVEIGYMLVERDAMLALFDTPDVSFSVILQRAAGHGKLAGLVSNDAYHSISDPVRWRLTEKYLMPKHILLIDRDGTINRRPPRGEYVTRWEDFHVIDDNVDAMAQLAKHDFRFIVISNQAGVGRGVMTSADVASINQKMTQTLKARGIELLDIYVCPHHWDDHCDCRKPAPGMFFRAAREYLLRMDRTIYIGDDLRDAVAADNAGCLSVLVGPECNAVTADGVRPDYAAGTLQDAVPWIMSQFENWTAH